MSGSTMPDEIAQVVLYHDRALTDPSRCSCGWRGSLGDLRYHEPLQPPPDGLMSFSEFGCPDCGMILASLHNGRPYAGAEPF